MNSTSSNSKKRVTFEQDDDDMLIDFGANGNFIHRDKIMDQNSISTVTESQVFLPDESGVIAAGTGLFCDQVAHFFAKFR